MAGVAKLTLLIDLNDLAQNWKALKDGQRHRAYQSASSSICMVPGDRVLGIQSYKKNQRKPDGSKAPKRQVYLTTEQGTFQVEGVGAKIEAKIKQLLATGTMTAAETARVEIAERADKKAILTPKAMFENVAGVGPATATDWAAQYNKTNREMTPLEWARAKKSKGATHQQQIGLRYYEDLQERIPRDYVRIIGLMIQALWGLEFGLDSFKMVVAGSYRRGAKDSGDIDILLSTTAFTLAQAVDVLAKRGIIVDQISMKDEKFMGIGRCLGGDYGRAWHIDIVLLQESEWGAGLLWFTGSKGFNISTRAKAIKKGLTLNQYGLFKTPKGGKAVELYRRGLLKPIATTEEGILAELGMPFFPPECR